MSNDSRSSCPERRAGVRGADGARGRSGQHRPGRVHARPRGALVSPPLERMISGSGRPASAACVGEPLEVAAQQRRQVGVDHRRRGALVLAEHAHELVRSRHVDARQRVLRRRGRRGARARDARRSGAGRRRRTRPARRAGGGSMSASAPLVERAQRPRRDRSARPRAGAARPAPAAPARARHGRYSSGRVWRAISSTSVKPSVVSSAVRAPRSSSSALVATVMPWPKLATSRGSIPARSSTMRTAAITPSDWSRRGGRHLAGEHARPRRRARRR